MANVTQNYFSEIQNGGGLWKNLGLDERIIGLIHWILSRYTVRIGGCGLDWSGLEQGPVLYYWKLGWRYTSKYKRWTVRVNNSLGPAVKAVVRLVHVAGSVPCVCSQGPGLAAILHPLVVSMVPRALSLLAPRETQWIYKNLLVGTLLLFEQEHCAADSNLKTKVSENHSS
jgi:hypothetical protein